MVRRLGHCFRLAARAALVVAVATLASPVGCGALWGLDELQYGSGGSGGSGAIGAGGSSSTSGSAGAGGSSSGTGAGGGTGGAPTGPTLTAGANHTCATDSSHTRYCWGQLGDDTGTNRDAPMPVSALPAAVTQLAAGNYHSCACTSPGSLYCWGRNGDGQLGDGTVGNRSIPTLVKAALCP